MMIAHVFHCLLTTFLYGGRKLCVKKQTDASDHLPPYPYQYSPYLILCSPSTCWKTNLVGKVGCHEWSALSPKIRNLADLRCPACHWESLPLGITPHERSPNFRQRVGIQPGRCFSRGDPILSPKNIPQRGTISAGGTRGAPPGKVVLMFAT